ncbi:MAG: hypothetical protein ACR2QM_05615 [Longimicrobiales bacterium]
MAPTPATSDATPPAPAYRGRKLRIFWLFLSAILAETVVFALAAMPAAAMWTGVLPLISGPLYVRVAVFCLTLVPSYLLFTLGLMVYSAWITRILGWRTPPNGELDIAELGRPLMNLLRGAAMHHFVRVFAGTLYRGSSLWTFYLRLNGARLGPRVYVNTLSLGDCSLLEIGEGSVIGSDVHIGGHWAEKGVMRTGPVSVGRGVTIGNCAVIGIGVTIEDGVQVGALSVVPKGVTLEGPGVYVGAPARRVQKKPASVGTPVQGS